MPRKLFYIPMVHRPEELGSLEGKTTTIQEKVFGKEKTKAFLKSIADYWELVSERIRGAGLYQTGNGSCLHVFIDSLPKVNEQLVQQILQDLIKQGLPAHKIAGELQKAGAKVYGTEDVQLITTEVQYWKDVAARKRQPNQDLENELLEKRDEVIIARINEVVSDEETAIVFIGRLHNVIEPLSESPYNFKVVQL